MTLKTFKNYHTYLHKTLLGVDFGQKTIGLATYTPGHDPYPLEHSSICLTDELRLGTEKIQQIISTENIHSVIFGLPCLADGEEGTMAACVRDFARTISPPVPCPILFQDEYLSSKQAKERLQSQSRYGLVVRGEHIHMESAKIILEDFIRAKGVE